MGDKTYEVSGETTEWEDILIKKGITTKAQVLMNKGLNPDDFLTDEELGKELGIKELTKAEEIDPLSLASLDELDELLEEDENEKAINAYREKRLQELKEQQARNRWGSVYDISRNDWISEVTECSKSCWVIVHLYQDSVIECNLVEDAFIKLAPKFKYVKFIKIRSTQAVENWPDRNLPTIFLYHDGELKLQVITLNSLGGKRMTANGIYLLLSLLLSLLLLS
jgi:hypothetical protein